MVERDEMERAKERCFELEKVMLMSSVRLRRCWDDQREWLCGELCLPPRRKEDDGGQSDPWEG